MTLLTSIKEGREYTKQISVYGGKVYAEIIYLNAETDKEDSVDLWLCSLHKSFGRMWASEPREKDYQAANAWADEQLALLEKYTTAKVKEAQIFIDKRLAQPS